MTDGGGVMRLVVMGVSGCGKSTLGRALADHLAIRFVEGDDLHPAQNVAKMSAGIPLTDDDRWPWLAKVADLLASDEPTIVACSALKRDYRDFIRSVAGSDVVFVHPNLPRGMLLERLRNRPNHYMPPTLLDSQLATLEPPQDDERVISVDAEETVLSRIVDRLRRMATI